VAPYAGRVSRIIAGRAGGARLRVPQGGRTRPTTDRVREALFSSLAVWAGGADRSPDDQLSGLRVLDLYAGSGAVGLEAASRGAREVVLVERDRAAARLIRGNAEAAGLADRVRVVTGSVEQFLAGALGAVGSDEAAVPAAAPSLGVAPLFDVIWLDPPYAVPSAEVDEVLGRVCRGWLADDGLVVAERSRRDPPPGWPAGLSDSWSRRYGETQLHFGRAASHDDPEGDE